MPSDIYMEFETGCSSTNNYLAKRLGGVGTDRFRVFQILGDKIFLCHLKDPDIVEGFPADILVEVDRKGHLL